MTQSPDYFKPLCTVHAPIQEAYSRPKVSFIRKSMLLEKLPFSKTTLHAKLEEGGPYHDPSFPRPVYMNNSRMPLWDEAKVDVWMQSLNADPARCELEGVVKGRRDRGNSDSKGGVK